METLEMLNRVKSKDSKAFCQLTEDYGWKVYSCIRERIGDADQVNAAFHETFSDFSSDLTSQDGSDAVEALLLAYADRVCSRMENASAKPAKAAPYAVPVPEAFRAEPSAEKKKTKEPGHGQGRIWFGLCVAVLLLGIAAAVWTILGLLMDMGYVPELDLGYSWFNVHIAPWFS